jgi:hypothetical protein
MKEQKNFRTDVQFKGFEIKEQSNKYFTTTSRVTEDKERIIVNIDEEHLIKTKFGYALILDNKNVVFVKEWQVEIAGLGCEVILDKNYFNVKKWGNHEEFDNDVEALEFEYWLKIVEEQKNMPSWRYRKSLWELF